MASRLNLLFHTAPKVFLERTVLFTHELATPESLAMARNRIGHHIDIQPLQNRSNAQLLAALHLYTDLPLTSYFVPPNGSILIPRNDSPYRFVFFPDFTGWRFSIAPDGADWLRIFAEQGLSGAAPAPEAAPGSRFIDSFAFWDCAPKDFPGAVRATAVLVKEPGQPWAVLMQQIVGTPGFEVVRGVISRPLRY